MLIRRVGAVLALVLGFAVALPFAASAPAQAADPNQPVRLAIAGPLTVPASSIGLIDADALEAYTRPLGLLTQQLDAVFGRQVAIGVDPMIIASIRALGTTAPESALVWLQRLEDAPNQIFPLAYGAQAFAYVTGKEPLLTVDGLRMSRYHMFFTSAKAERELGYRSRAYQEGVVDALAWFRQAGYLT